MGEAPNDSICGGLRRYNSDSAEELHRHSSPYFAEQANGWGGTDGIVCINTQGAGIIRNFIRVGVQFHGDGESQCRLSPITC